jgi:hypothetical protein
MQNLPFAFKQASSIVINLRYQFDQCTVMNIENRSMIAANAQFLNAQTNLCYELNGKCLAYYSQFSSENQCMKQEEKIPTHNSVENKPTRTVPTRGRALQLGNLSYRSAVRLPAGGKSSCTGPPVRLLLLILIAGGHGRSLQSCLRAVLVRFRPESLYPSLPLLSSNKSW